ncbi:barstar family protein [Nocardioides seonyuensis]|uniref:barstar family protein n=1 Tax=Nocardioides seonyuensis TaxID=2518371 RepID=UPI001424344B|nr:barstar family protein [Nocardioides seonyuensis]
MSGLAAVLAGHEPPGVYLWRSALEPAAVREAVENADWVLGHVDGWVSDGTSAAFLADVGRALHFPEHYGQNFDALADCLRDIGAGRAGVVLLWDGWATLARHDERAFGIALDVLAERAGSDREVPFTVLLRGDGPAVPGLRTLD